MKKGSKTLIKVITAISIITLVLGITYLILYINAYYKMLPFSDDEVCVYLTNEKSLETLDYIFTGEDFEEVGAIEVRDSTPELQLENIKKKMQGQPIDETKSPWMYEVEDFQRELRIRLSSKSKSYVLYAIEVLERRPDVDAAYPIYLGYAEAISNDMHRSNQWGLDKIYNPFK